MVITLFERVVNRPWISRIHFTSSPLLPQPRCTTYYFGKLGEGRENFSISTKPACQINYPTNKNYCWPPGTVRKKELCNKCWTRYAFRTHTQHHNKGFAYGLHILGSPISICSSPHRILLLERIFYACWTNRQNLQVHIHCILNKSFIHYTLKTVCPMQYW